MAKERWYRDGLRFGCRQCGRCCSGEPGYVWVTDEEVAAIAQELSLTKADFEKLFVRLVFGRKLSLAEREARFAPAREDFDWNKEKQKLIGCVAHLLPD